MIVAGIPSPSQGVWHLGPTPSAPSTMGTSEGADVVVVADDVAFSAARAHTRNTILYVKSSGWPMPMPSTAVATAGQESGEGQ